MINSIRFAGIRQLVLPEKLKGKGLNEEKLLNKYQNNSQYADTIDFQVMRLDKESGERNSIPHEPQSHVGIYPYKDLYLVISSNDKNRFEAILQEKFVPNQPLSSSDILSVLLNEKGLDSTGSLSSLPTVEWPNPE